MPSAFVLRLVLVLFLTVGLVGVAAERYISGTVRAAFIAEQLQDVRGDARAIEESLGGQDLGEALRETQDLIAFADRRRGITSVELVNIHGRVVAAGDPEQVGTSKRGMAVAAATAGVEWGGNETEAHDKDGGLEYVVPLRANGHRYGLEVDQERRILDSRLRAITREMLMVGLLALPTAVALFFLLGGRAIVNSHATAVRGSTRDGLTGAGNRRAFQVTLETAWSRFERHGEQFVLAVVDVDEFKMHNDRLGHEYGDRVLVEVTAALGGGRREDACFRLGGDEFAVVLSHTDFHGARAALERAMCHMAAQLSGIHLSIGLARPAPGQGIAALREQADTAAYEAKRAGGNRIVAFDDISAAVAVSDAEALAALDELVAAGDFDVAFQPVWDLERDAIFAYEAFSRPEHEAFPTTTGAFELAAKVGRAHLLDTVARHSAFKRASRLPAGALLFVNVAPQTLETDGFAGVSLVEEVRAAGLAPYQVVLEINERSTRRLKHVAAEIARLRELGFKISLDDVGAGNAGLELLSAVRVDFVKLDQSVVTQAEHDRAALGVLEAVITFARRVDAMVIAEGVETEAQLSLVRDPRRPEEDFMRGVQGGQGFLLGRPAGISIPRDEALMAIGVADAGETPPDRVLGIAGRGGDGAVAEPPTAAGQAAGTDTTGGEVGIVVLPERRRAAAS